MKLTAVLKLRPKNNCILFAAVAKKNVAAGLWPAVEPGVPPGGKNRCHPRNRESTLITGNN